MANVKYKKPSQGMIRMVVKSDDESRPSIGLTEVKGEIYYLSPNIIIPYKNQARRDINEENLLELMSSIRSQGIIQPLQIIPSLKDEGKFEVVSGERRLIASKKIGLDKVPCMILDRGRDADEIALIENIQRENLHPIELADAIANLMEKNQKNQSEIAERIGVSKQQISHLMAISRLPEDVKEHLIQKTDIKVNFLKKIAYLKDKDFVRESVFGSRKDEEKFKSILRLSSNGKTIRFDHFKIANLSNFEKNLLTIELKQIIEKLDF
jgi:ParB family chromosome partitioning protein